MRDGAGRGVPVRSRGEMVATNDGGDQRCFGQRPVVDDDVVAEEEHSIAERAQTSGTASIGQRVVMASTLDLDDQALPHQEIDASKTLDPDLPSNRETKVSRPVLKDRLDTASRTSGDGSDRLDARARTSASERRPASGGDEPLLQGALDRRERRLGRLTRDDLDERLLDGLNELRLSEPASAPMHNNVGFRLVGEPDRPVDRCPQTRIPGVNRDVQWRCIQYPHLPHRQGRRAGDQSADPDGADGRLVQVGQAVPALTDTDHHTGVHCPGEVPVVMPASEELMRRGEAAEFGDVAFDSSHAQQPRAARRTAAAGAARMWELTPGSDAVEERSKNRQAPTSAARSQPVVREMQEIPCEMRLHPDGFGASPAISCISAHLLHLTRAGWGQGATRPLPLKAA